MPDDDDRFMCYTSAKQTSNTMHASTIWYLSLRGMLSIDTAVIFILISIKTKLDLHDLPSPSRRKSPSYPQGHVVNLRDTHGCASPPSYNDVATLRQLALESEIGGFFQTNAVLFLNNL